MKSELVRSYSILRVVRKFVTLLQKLLILSLKFIEN